VSTTAEAMTMVRHIPALSRVLTSDPSTTRIHMMGRRRKDSPVLPRIAYSDNSIHITPSVLWFARQQFTGPLDKFAAKPIFDSFTWVCSHCVFDDGPLTDITESSLLRAFITK